MKPRRPLLIVMIASLALAVTGAPAHAENGDAGVRINEVVTTGKVDDSVELVNTGSATVDVSGWIIRDDGDGSKYKIASGTSLAPGAFRAFDVHKSVALGSSDQARLFLPDGSTLVDGVAWTEHSNPSWSRCPDGTGPLRAAELSLGAPNRCSAWPGGSAVSTADASNVFGDDLSGLFQDGSVLWAAQNSGKLWRLARKDDGGWTPEYSKTLRYPGGTGSPDSESVTVTPAGLYIGSERNTNAPATSRLSVLRYDVSSTNSTLTATREWNLTADLPATGANLGIEALTFIPDAALTSAGFLDGSTHAAYDPARYSAHGGGVFFVGIESTGMVHGYVLQDSGSFTRVASFSSGFAGVMELQWEPAAARLWAVCDDTCDGRHRTFKIGSSRTFEPVTTYDRPSGMPNYNNEGFALAPADECAGGLKPVYWADDSNDGGHALRREPSPADGKSVGRLDRSG